MGAKRVWVLMGAMVAAGCAGAGIGSDGNATFGAGEGDDTGHDTDAATDTDVDGASATSSASTASGETSGATTLDDTATDGPGNAAMPFPVAVRVDVSGNGMLEPGETVQLEPAWEHAENFQAALNGTLQDLNGPAGAVYQVFDDMAAYVLPPGGSAFCSATTDCYSIRVDASTRPSTHWDITASEMLSTGDGQDWVLHVGASFTDVSPSSLFYQAIETLLHHDMTAGCTQTQFCPGDDLTRSQAAIFIARVMSGGIGQIPNAGSVSGLGNYDCAAGTSLFADVPASSIACPAVHFLAANGITSGCSANPPSFCPSDLALRRHFAVFLAAALAGDANSVPIAYVDPETGLGYDCSASTPNVHFSDVPTSASWCKHVHYIWARGATQGCGTTTFCPDNATRRGQAAALLVDGFKLELE